MKLLGVMTAAGWLALAITTTQAQQTAPPASPTPVDYSKIEIKTTNLGAHTYMLEGQGGNMTLAVGDDGAILVDSEFALLHDKIKAAIEAVTNQPVKVLINTHYHGDHTDGNAAFGKEGVIIVAHQNVKSRLASPSPGANGQTPPAAPAEALPTRVFTDKTTVSVGGRTAQVIHIANAHTDGDSYVYFTDANVLATGDIVSSTRYPNIDVRAGGGIDGMIAGTDVFMNLANNQTKIVPGHGPLATKADLQAYHDMLVSARDRVTKLKVTGMTEDQVVAAKPLAVDIQLQRQADDAASERFVRLVYQSVR